MLSCSIWFSTPSFWMGGGLESRCVGRVCGADGAVHGSSHCLGSWTSDDGTGTVFTSDGSWTSDDGTGTVFSSDGAGHLMTVQELYSQVMELDI